MKKHRPRQKSPQSKARGFLFYRISWVTILLFLLLGAILNIVVAWGCGFLFFRNVTPWEEMTDDWRTEYSGVELVRPISQLVRDAHKDFMPEEFQEAVTGEGWSGIISFGFGRYGLDSSTIQKRDGEWVDDRNFGTDCVFMGWPMYSLWGFDIYEVKEWDAPFKEPIEIGFVTTGNIRVSILPRWTGFIFNTFFYAIPLWLLFPGRYMLRRRRRIGRGLCGGCGYVVSVNVGVAGASLNCTECGMAIHQG